MAFSFFCLFLFAHVLYLMAGNIEHVLFISRLETLKTNVVATISGESRVTS